MSYSVTIAFILLPLPSENFANHFESDNEQLYVVAKIATSTDYAALLVPLIFGGKRAAEAPHGNPNGRESCSPGIDDSHL